jgi:hypothetical protein
LWGRYSTILLSNSESTQTDFTYSIVGKEISIIDLDLGNRPVTNETGRELSRWPGSAARCCTRLRVMRLPSFSRPAKVEIFQFDTSDSSRLAGTPLMSMSR